MPKHWSNEVIETTRKMRKDGNSFGQINKELNVPKSTLWTWVKDLPRFYDSSKVNNGNWLKEIRPLAVAANRKKYQQLNDAINKRVEMEIRQINLGKIDFKAVLSMLYWAEGAKNRNSVLIFANTDPQLVLLFITLLRKCFMLDEKKLRVRLHLHYYHKENNVKNFWSNLLEIPESQFGKTFRKKRSKEKTFRRNFGGICFVKYNSVYLQREITLWARLLATKITGIAQIPGAPIA